tara:strand:- start:167 stop:316 length:150 start_codon:yes stop_codon:yes gene_type:complete
MNQSYFDTANSNDFGLREICEVIELSFGGMHLGLGCGKGFKPFLRLYQI